MKRIIALIMIIISICTFSVTTFANEFTKDTLPLIYPIANFDVTFVREVGTYQVAEVMPGGISYPSGSAIILVDQDSRTYHESTETKGLYTCFAYDYNVSFQHTGWVIFSVYDYEYNPKYDYLPSIYIEDETQTLNTPSVYYGGDPVAYMNVSFINRATGVRQVYNDLPINLLENLEVNSDGSKYYHMFNMFKDPHLPEDIRLLFSNTNFHIDYLTLQIMTVGVPNVTKDRVRFRYGAYRTYVNEQGVLIDPLNNYYQDTFGSMINNAKKIGYDQGYYEGKDDGIGIGYEQGEQDGYNWGYSEGATKGFNFTTFLASSLSSVMDVQLGFLTLGSVLGVVVAILLVKWILKLIGGG